MTIAECLRKIAQIFKQNDFIDSQKESRILLQEALGVSAVELIVQSDRTLSSSEQAHVDQWVRRRSAGEPLAYISGIKGFYKAEFLVQPGVLIPRPETEFVVTTALAYVRDPVTMADWGCGSGCIGLSLLGEWPKARLLAVDASPIAVDVTKRNAERLALSDRTTVIHSRVEDWSPPNHLALDLIVANPPYVAEGDPRVEPGVHLFEPHSALYSGDEGLDALRRWTSAAYRQLRDGGFVVFEIGAGQTEAVQAIMKASGFKTIEVTHDLSGIDRVISASK